jgi:hypothetical protein
MSDSVRIVLDTPGPTVTVEANADIATVSAEVERLYHMAMKDWKPTRGLAAGSGFTTERLGECLE